MKFFGRSDIDSDGTFSQSLDDGFNSVNSVWNKNILNSFIFSISSLFESSSYLIFSKPPASPQIPVSAIFSPLDNS